MAVTITLTDEIETELQNKAEAQKRSVEDLVLEILGTALEAEAAFPLLEEVVAKIKATPPNPGSIRPSRGSLAEALRSTSPDSDFDLAKWNREWAAVEAEMKAITLADDIAEGRG